ncbi:MAG: NTP transferase domain-containing protein [Alphaproteobacteria bacterium]|nr:NTP transferase domain-containing protein [Alphaproteobacteria bacterium]
MSAPRIAAIVQARMGSTRLPGKSLRVIAGQPLIWHVIHRLKGSRHIGQVVLATTTNPVDDPLAAWAERAGVACVRGSEDDVLGRFALAAEACDPDIIVRVNADAPLIDAAFIDAMLDAMLAEDADFVLLKPGTVALHDGVDPMSRRALNLMLTEAREDPVAREHVTGWLKLHSHRIKVALMTPDPAYAFEGARLSVDTPDDVAFIEAVYDRLKAQAGEASLTDLIGLLRRDRSLLGLNANVKQKAATATAGTVLIRCDGGEALGMGHVKRCLSLSKALRDRQGLGAVFAMDAAGKASALVEAAGFPVALCPAGTRERDWISDVLRAHAALGLVLDVRTDLSESDVRSLRDQVPLIVAVDDASPRRLAAHIAVYPPVGQTRALAWPGGDVDLCVGWSWALMGSEPWRVPRPLDAGRATLKVLVAMGGSDPQGLTLRAVKAVAAAGRRVTPVVVIGPATRFPEALADACQAAAPDADIRFAPDSLLPVAAECDLAVIAYGVSAFECAHVGTPALYLGLTGDHALSAQAFEDAGFGLNMGVVAGLNDRKVTDAIARLVADPEQRRAMAAAGRLAIDGQGADRLAAEIARRVAANATVRLARAG